MALFLAVLSGLLAGFSFPRYGFAVCAWVAYVPLFFSVRFANGTNPFRTSYLYGFISGFVSNVILLYWVVVAMHTYGGIGLPASILGLVLLAGILSVLYYGTFTLIIKLFWSTTIPGELLFIPVVWVLLEYVRTYLFSGFPWELLGYSQYKNLSLIQISRFTSVYGVSGIVMLFNVLIYEFVVWWYDIKSKRTAQYPYLFAKTVTVVLLITVVLIYGDITIGSTRAFLQRPGNDIPVGLIQGNIDQNHKWDPGYQKETMRSYFSLTQKSLDSVATQLVIWPETATPFFIQSEPAYRTQMGEFVRSRHIYLLFGSPAYADTGTGFDYFNSAFVMGPDGAIIGRYDKRHLVPFGEYLPLKHLFFFLRKMTGNIGDFTAGRKNNLLQFGRVKIGTLICYEIIFPGLSARDARNGANLLVTITDDAWFGNTSAPYQDLSMSTFRAVENERFVLRAANTGISAVISPTGEILSSTKLFVPAFINDRVRLIGTKTFYTLHGDLFVLLCAAVFLLFAAYAVYSKLTLGKMYRG